MQIPDQFQNIFAFFGQHMTYSYTKIEDMAHDAIISRNLKGNEEAKAYFDDLTSGKYTAGQLQSLWRNSRSEIYFANGDQVLWFLKLMRSMMD